MGQALVVAFACALAAASVAHADCEKEQHAVDEAKALLEAAGPSNSTWFARYLDTVVSLGNCVHQGAPVAPSAVHERCSTELQDLQGTTAMLLIARRNYSKGRIAAFVEGLANDYTGLDECVEKTREAMRPVAAPVRPAADDEDGVAPSLDGIGEPKWSADKGHAGRDARDGRDKGVIYSGAVCYEQHVAEQARRIVTTLRGNVEATTRRKSRIDDQLDLQRLATTRASELRREASRLHLHLRACADRDIVDVVVCALNQNPDCFDQHPLAEYGEAVQSLVFDPK